MAHNCKQLTVKENPEVEEDMVPSLSEQQAGART